MIRDRTNLERASIVFVVVVVAVIAGTGAAMLVAAGESQVGFAGVSVEPDHPHPNEPVTIAPTIQNTDERAYSIDSVVLEGDSHEDRVLSPGTVPPGETFEVPLRTSFDEPGIYDLDVEVKGSMDGQQVDRRFPVTVTVTDAKPAVSIDTTDSVVGNETTATVTVDNGNDRSLENLEIEVSGESFERNDDRQTVSRLPAGETEAFEFTVTPKAEGERELTVDVTYSTRTGLQTNVSRMRTVDVDPLEVDVDLSATTTEPGGYPDVEVTLENLGNAPVEKGTIEVVTEDGRVIERTGLPVVESGERATEVISMNHDAIETLSVQASYESGTIEETIETTVAYVPNPASIELTGVEVEPGDDGDVTLITGTASNVGLERADSVLVRIQETGDVEPAQPNEEFFVGTVAESDFGTFDLSARLDEETTEIPIEVTFVSDGQQESYVENVSMHASNPTGSGDVTGSVVADSGWKIPAVVGGAIVLGVVGIMANVVRKSRSGVGTEESTAER